MIVASIDAIQNLNFFFP